MRPRTRLRIALLSLAALLAVVPLAAPPLHAAGAPASRPAAAAPAELVPWHQDGDFAAVLARAKKDGKLVFIDFYATWCGPCKMMDRQTYTDSVVAAEAGRFVSRKIDAEKGEGVALARKYAVTAYPTMLVVNADGAEVNRQVGFLPAPRFARFLEDTRTGRGTIDGLEALLRKGEDGPDTRAALAEKYAQRGDFTQARAQLEAGAALPGDDPSGRLVEAALGAASQAAGQGQPEIAIALTDLFLGRFPAHPRRADLFAQKAAALAAMDRNDEALDAFRHVVELRSAEPAVLATFARLSAMTGLALDEGLARAQQAVKLAPDQAYPFDALGEVYAAREQWDDAVAAAEKAVAARPTDGSLRGKLERYQERAVAAARSGSH
jgi:thiol-disulfide isomerase/thioredoxin